MSLDPEPSGEPRPHRYDLFDDGQPIARLEWRAHPRRQTGWYFTPRTGPPLRLDVDPSIDELAADTRSADHDWQLNAELAAILSTPLALDAAERLVHPSEQPAQRRFRRLSTATRYEIYVADVASTTLAHAIPELPLTSVSDVSVLEGELLPEACDRVVRRIALLGGRVVAILRDTQGPGLSSGS
jgi:hypothetical protein